MKNGNSILINSTITTVGPLSIKMPVVQGGMENKFGNFPLFTLAQRKYRARTARATQRKNRPGTFPRRQSVVFCDAPSSRMR